MKWLRFALAAAMIVAPSAESALARGGFGGGFHGGFRGGGFHGGFGGAGMRPGGFGGGFRPQQFGGGFHPGGPFAGINRSGSFSRPNLGAGGFQPGSLTGGLDNRFGHFQYHPNTLTELGNRLDLGDRLNIRNRANLGDRQDIANRLQNRDGNLANRIGRNPPNRPLRPARNYFNQLNWHHGNWHGHWNRNWWWHRPAWWWWGPAWGAFGFYAAVIPWTWGYWPYYNPYATAPYVVDNTTINYSQPILAMGDAGSADDPSSDAEQASKYFEEARQAFEQQDYRTALDDVNQAIAKAPDEPVLHEFRGLVLFATGKYHEAAAAIYAVLSTGPGWDWTTLSSLYPNVDLFTRQLRALENYSGEHPDQADAAFLLAYEYLTMGSTDAAVDELKQVVRLEPKDQLSAQLLDSLTSKPEDQPPQADKTAAGATPVTAAQLAGDWTFSRPDGSSIKLDLGSDSQYTWTFTHDGKTESHSGKYSVADNLLVLNQDDSPAMAGQVTDVSGRSFNFRLMGSSPNDPGLTFTK